MRNNGISELILKRFVWTRTNTIELYKMAENANVLQYKPKYLIENPTENHNVLYQFQCIFTSTNTHFRRLKNDENTRFGIYVKNEKITKKQEIQPDTILNLLQEQIDEARILTTDSKELNKLLATFITIGEHESLHQGQLIVMFRETKIEFPQEFKEAWNL